MSNQTFITALGGSLGEGHGTTGYGGGGEQIVKNTLVDFYLSYTKSAADGMASTTTSNTLIWMNPYDFSVKIVSAKIAPAATLTADNTNYATITLKTDDGAAGTPATALQWDTTVTGTGNWAIGVAEAATTTTVASLTIVSGGCLWFNIAKAGSGVVVPISIYNIRLTKLG